MLRFAAPGAGSGTRFQLVPLPGAVTGSMIGEIGALGGGLAASHSYKGGRARWRNQRI